MRHTARISQRSAKFVGAVSNHARVNIQMQLSKMKCEQFGHIPGKRLSDVGAEHKEISVCGRCFRVMEEKKLDNA